MQVSFGKRTRLGLITDFVATPPLKKIKPLQAIIRAQVLQDWQLKTGAFLQNYFAAGAGPAFQLFIPPRIWQNRPLKQPAEISPIRQTPARNFTLNPAQAKALARIEKTQKPVLLHGVTGSGKTEIYLRLIQKVLAQKKQAILLVPEIALTPQLVSYFSPAVPPQQIAVLHSNLAEGTRLQFWEKIHAGKIALVIGARLALFAPTPKPALLILDEEHEWTYKNEKNPRYHARTIAQKIAEFTGARLILGSATPSLETYHAVQQGRAELIQLPTRVNGKPLPKVTLVDLRQEAKGTLFFSELLKAKITEKLERQEQIVLLLNRRGFARVIICQQCGANLACPNCDLPLTYHRTSNQCLCHLCGFERRLPPSCAHCSASKLKLLGAGTQKIELSLQELFPQARVLRADRDTTSKRAAHQKIYENFKKGAADILLGTQIVAKGLDLPQVTLVGILLADSGLHFPDFRAAEKTFALLTQAAGRAGRAQEPGEVIIQTYAPEHPALSAAQKHDYLTFSQTELQLRQQFHWPPYLHLIRFIFTHSNASQAQTAAEHFAQDLTELGEKRVATAAALIARSHGKFHFQVIWRGPDPRELLKKIQLPRQVRVDVDPVNFWKTCF